MLLQRLEDENGARLSVLGLCQVSHRRDLGSIIMKFSPAC
jgi:hypothetical protein